MEATRVEQISTVQVARAGIEGRCETLIVAICNKSAAVRLSEQLTVRPTLSGKALRTILGISIVCNTSSRWYIATWQNRETHLTILKRIKNFLRELAAVGIKPSESCLDFSAKTIVLQVLLKVLAFAAPFLLRPLPYVTDTATFPDFIEPHASECDEICGTVSTASHRQVSPSMLWQLCNLVWSTLTLPITLVCAPALAYLRILLRYLKLIRRKKMSEIVNESQVGLIRTIAEPGNLTTAAALSYQVRMRSPKHAGKDKQTRPKCNRLFNIIEILEQILLNLPMLDLLLSQRVCCRWRALAQSSLSIRRALFLEPSTYGPVSYIDWEFDDRGYYYEWWKQTGNPLHSQPLRSPDGALPIRYKAHWGVTREDAGLYRVYENPLLAKLFPVVSRNGVWTQPVDLAPSWLSREASWRRMSITQPPIAQLYIKCDNRESPTAWELRPIYQFPTLRMGYLYSKLALERRMSWIMGSEDWQEWTGAGDLDRIVAARASMPEPSCRIVSDSSK